MRFFKPMMLAALVGLPLAAAPVMAQTTTTTTYDQNGQPVTQVPHTPGSQGPSKTTNAGGGESGGSGSGGGAAGK